MIRGHLPCPDDLRNIRGAFGYEKVLSQLDASPSLLTPPGANCFNRSVDEDVKDDEEVLQQTNCNVLDHGLEFCFAARSLWKRVRGDKVELCK